MTKIPLQTEQDLPLYAVRPTTPMGPLMTTSQINYGMNNEFPKTQLILIASALVIAFIAIVVFWVFCCRQQQHPGTMKPPPTAIQGGYQPIPSESSPPNARCQTNIISMNGNGHCVSNPNINGNIKSNNEMNGMNATIPLLLSQPPSEKKKDFKEWYV